MISLAMISSTMAYSHGTFRPHHAQARREADAAPDFPNRFYIRDAEAEAVADPAVALEGIDIRDAAPDFPNRFYIRDLRYEDLYWVH